MKTIPIGAKVSLIAAVSLLAAVATTQAQNVLVDPGFEAGTTAPNPNPSLLPGWSLFNGGAFSTAQALGGTHSLVEAGGGGFQVPGAFESFASGPGTAWTLTGSALVSSTPGAGASFALLQISFFDSGGANLGTVETSPGNAFGSAQVNNTSPLNTWIPLSVTAHAPAGTASIQAFAITIDQNPITAYFDNMSLTAAPEPSTLALLGLGLAGIPMFLRRKKA